ncbi:hypothetical protein [Oscillatoria sp. FACHB-1407]|uniref:hypothetical protein n=1 Tax=Oscillatoria sp. FACHB-1407 TaxID=2692847 RepID=UPI0018EFCAF4|nr:hypothetical protein [Oscillatoria sp. FACHB-1407]
MKLFSFLTIAVFNAVAIASTLPALAQSTPAPESPQQGCLSGNPDGTFQGDAQQFPFQGNRPVTRYEFAAGLNACLEQTLQQMQQGDLATREDFEATLQRQQELNEELRELSERVAPTPDPASSPSDSSNGGSNFGR